MKEVVTAFCRFPPILGGFFIFRGVFMKKNQIKKLTVVAVLCAVAYLCTFVFHFKLQFLTFDFKDAVITVGSLMYGPIVGLVSAAVVAFIEFITVSDTGVYGLIMNFISSAVFSATAGVIYKYRRSFSGAIISIITAVITLTAAMMLANLFITPLYMGVPRAEVAALIPKLLLPFNLIKAVMNAAITLIIYKPIATAFRSMSLIEPINQGQKGGLKSVILITVSLCVAAAAVLFFVFYLKGSFSALG